jgi:GDPmannose 4,6-dehydratase
MWLILQQDEPDDYVIATGEQHSVREFIEAAAGELGMDIEWRGSGLDEVGVDRKTGREIIVVDPRYFRPTEVETLLGDPSKAKRVLGWQARTSFADLVKEMVAADREGVQRSQAIKEAGFEIYQSYD